MCIGNRPSAPDVPPAPPIPALPHGVSETAGSAQRNQRIAASRRAQGTGRRHPTLLQEGSTTSAPVLLGR